MKAMIRARWAALVVLTLSGCANLAPLPEPPPAAPDGPLTVVGRGGRAVSPEVQRRIERALEGLGDDGALRNHLAVMESISDSPLIIGNRVRLLVDGPAAYARMFDTISAARDHVDIEMFIFDEAHNAGRDLSDLLLKKVSEGVVVRVLYDSLGSRSTPREFLDKLSNGGVTLCEFNPLAPGRLRKASFTQRDHRKIVVVDGRTGFAGGINFSGTYSSGSRSHRARASEAVKDGWRDTNIEVDGPAVREMQALYAASWEKQKCSAPPRTPVLRDAPAVGSTLLRLDASSTDSRSNETYLAALSSLEAAQETIDLTMAYFSPDPRLEKALAAAASRGVRVRLLLPGLLDFGGILHAGRAHYTRLLEAGVQIFEEPRALLHAKTLEIDGVLSTVGSANWDYLSFALNDELNVVVVDRDFGSQMRKLFEEDLSHAVRIELDSWQRRPLRQKLLQRFWLTWERLL
ncbi:MAG: phospholipase D-like domain-containing protein [Steroidobacteraceae bacterium]